MIQKHFDADGAPCMACGAHSGGVHDARCPLRGTLRLGLYYKQIVYENGVPKRDERGQIVVAVCVERGVAGMSEAEIAEAQTSGIEISKLSQKTQKEIMRGVEKSRRRGTSK